MKRDPQPIEAAADPDALLTMATVCTLTGFKRTKIYQLIREGKFPEPERFNPRFVRWKARGVRAFLQNPIV